MIEMMTVSSGSDRRRSTTGVITNVLKVSPGAKVTELAPDPENVEE
jgi:hypothetical protein